MDGQKMKKLDKQYVKLQAAPHSDCIEIMQYMIEGKENIMKNKMIYCLRVQDDYKIDKTSQNPNTQHIPMGKPLFFDNNFQTTSQTKVHTLLLFVTFSNNANYLRVLQHIKLCLKSVAKFFHTKQILTSSLTSM